MANENPIRQCPRCHSIQVEELGSCPVRQFRCRSCLHAWDTGYGENDSGADDREVDKR